MDNALIDYLIDQPEIAAIIGERFFYDIIPEKQKLPACVWMDVDDVPDYTHQGMVDLRSPNIQISCHAATRKAAKALAALIIAAMEKLNAREAAISGFDFQFIRLINNIGSTDTNADGTMVSKTQDLEFEINYKEVA